jgi:hypothetical protein
MFSISGKSQTSPSNKRMLHKSPKLVYHIIKKKQKGIGQLDANFQKKKNRKQKNKISLTFAT